MEDVDRGKELLVLTIDIGNGRNDFIHVHEYDDSVYLAREFANKYALEPKVEKNLQVMIQENLKEMKTELLSKDSINEEVNHSNFLSPIKNEVLQTEEARSIHTHTSGSKNKKKQAKVKTGNISVFGEVYRKLKGIEPSKSMSSMSTTSKKDGVNYGDYLYAKGLKDKEHSVNLVLKKKQEMFEKDIHHFTFSPMINANSSVISPRAADRPELLLFKKDQEKQEKIQKLREDIEKEALKECTFVPKINNSSKSKEFFSNKHEELYSQAQQLKEKRNQDIEVESKKFPFKPNAGCLRKRGSETTEEFFDRLESSKRVSENEIEYLRNSKILIEMSECKQFREGEADSKDLSRHNSEPIWEYLYNQRDKKKKDLMISQKEVQKTFESISGSRKISDNSAKIFDDYRRRHFGKLFDDMDADGDGRISANSIDINSFDIELLKVLTPFFEELDQIQGEIDVNQFTERMEELYNGLNAEKKSILTKRIEKNTEQEVARNPYISPRSHELAEKNRERLPQDLYERQNMMAKMREMKVKQNKEKIEKQKHSECRFKPVIISK